PSFPSLTKAGQAAMQRFWGFLSAGMPKPEEMTTILAGRRPGRAGIVHSVTAASSRSERGPGKEITFGAALPVREAFPRGAGRFDMTTGRFSGARPGA